MKTITPTFDKPNFFYSDEVGNIGQLIKFSLLSPGGVSDANRGRLISFTSIYARCGDGHQAADAYERALSAALSELYPDKSYVVSVEFVLDPEDEFKTPTGRLRIRIATPAGTNIFSHDNIVLDPESGEVIRIESNKGE